MAETRRLTALVSAALARASFPPGGMTVALSGGADSAALTRIAVDSGVPVRAIHIDHGLPGSPGLADAALAVADVIGVECDVTVVEVGSGPSLEDQAREARYTVLHAVTGPVVTGHTRDDSAETVLLNLVRGTGPDGLTGIPWHRPPNVYRPILDVSRDETREIAVLAGLPFRDDPMNRDMRLARNRIRHSVLPLLAELNPRVTDAVARAGGVLRRDHDYLSSLVSDIDLSGGLPAGVFAALPPPLADRLLYRLLEGYGIGVTTDRIERAREVAQGAAPRHDIAGGRSVARRGAMIVVE